MSFNLVQVLLDQGLLNQGQVKLLEKEAKNRNVSPELLIYEQKLVPDDKILEVKSQSLNLPVKFFGDEESIPREILLLIPFESSRHYEMIAFAKDAGVLQVGMVNPEESSAQQALKFIAQGLGLDLKIHLILKKDLEKLSKGYTSFGEEISKTLKSLQQQAQGAAKAYVGQKKTISLDETFDVTAEQAPVIKLVSDILKNAILQRASDIHLEPERNRLRVRYRIDGDLFSVVFLLVEIHPAILTRIKILADLKIDETRSPQDGRFSAFIAGRQIDFRVSTFPTQNGEKAALRILDPNSGLKNLEDLGLSPWNLSLIKNGLKRPFGMVLATGPTGSGKTTTLYAILQILNQDSVNVVTLEDPVEYFMNGVNQSQVIPEIGYTFASGLRTILRQDPNVIMVGEIRDSETAELAVHAALTGHLMFSTLHTNTAIGGIPRLIDMGIEPFLLSSSLRMVIAQRLVRRICEKSKEEIQAPDSIKKIIAGEIAEISAEEFQKYKLDKNGEINFYRGKGCDACNGTGLKGRVAIYEVIPVTEKIKNIIVEKRGSEELIAKERDALGILTIKQDGILKILKGLTTIEE